MTKNIHVSGKKVYIRPLREKDINKKYLSWLNDPEVTKYIRARFSPPNMIDLMKYYEDVKGRKEARMFAIIAKDNDAHIGNIKLDFIDHYHKFANLGIIIGEKRYWGRGCGQEACVLLLRYAFNTMKLNKVVLGVCAENIPAVKAYEKIGFETEGRFKKILNFEGRFVDELLMSISNEAFRRRNKK